METACRLEVGTGNSSFQDYRSGRSRHPSGPLGWHDPEAVMWSGVNGSRPDFAGATCYSVVPTGGKTISSVRNCDGSKEGGSHFATAFASLRTISPSCAGATGVAGGLR